MFVTVQMPIVDNRPFLNCETYKLSVPTWPIPIPFREFTRYFGQIEVRKKGGVKEWIGEETYCSARGAVRFVNSPEMVKGKNYSYKALCAFRRFFSDGEVVSRLELGIRLRAKTVNGVQMALNPKDLIQIVYKILKLPVKIRSLNNSMTSTTLMQSGCLISNLYLNASSKRPNFNEKFLKSWWVAFGEPILVVEYSQSEISKLPKSFLKLNSIKDVDLSHGYFHINNNFTHRAWFIGTHSNTNKDILRRLRINLLRLHAEQECLKIVLHNICNGKIKVCRDTNGTETLQQFLKVSFRNLSCNNRFGLPQQEISKVALENQNLVTEGERASILAALEKVRRNVYSTVKQFTENSSSWEVPVNFPNTEKHQQMTLINIGGIRIVNTTSNFSGTTSFSGPYIIAESIHNCLNTVSEARVDQELEQSLKELIMLVKELCEQLSLEQAEEVTKDIELITREVTSSNPRLKWCISGAEGITKAAATSVLANSITKALQGVLDFLR